MPAPFCRNPSVSSCPWSPRTGEVRPSARDRCAPRRAISVRTSMCCLTVRSLLQISLTVWAAARPMEARSSGDAARHLRNASASPSPIPDQLHHSPEAGGDNGKARTHGFYADIRKVLPARRHNRAVCACEKAQQFAPTHGAVESKPWPQTARQPPKEYPLQAPYIGAHEIEMDVRIFTRNARSRLDPFDDPLAGLQTANETDAASRPNLRAPLDQRRETHGQVDHRDAIRPQSEVLPALARKVMAGAQQGVRRIDAEFFHALHGCILPRRAHGAVVVTYNLAWRMKVHDAGRMLLRSDPQCAPQEQIVKRRLPVLSLHDIDSFAVDQPLGEECGVPGKPLSGKIRFLETIELLRNPRLGSHGHSLRNIVFADAMDDQSAIVKTLPRLGRVLPALADYMYGFSLLGHQPRDIRDIGTNATRRISRWRIFPADDQVFHR